MVLLNIFLITYFATLNTALSICTSKIYCEGRFFEHMIETDSLLYKAMRYPESIILSNFDQLLQNTSNRPTYDDLIKFREEYFIDENVGVTVLSDYYASSSFIEKILSKSRTVGEVTRNLVSSWNDHAVNGTTMRELPKKQYSLISPYGFINTNTELETQCTYWDHYWIVNGLLASNMHNTARSLIKNLVSMVKEYGMVPAANRIFFVGRSNPPLLTPMAYDYFMTTKCHKCLLEDIQYLEEELSFWVKYRSINYNLNGKNYMLYRYHSNITKPRPEMYRLDTAFVESLANKENVYKELNTLTETGGGIIDRWIYRPDNTTTFDLSHIKPSKVIPVDLNSFLYKGFTCLSKLYKVLENNDKRRYWNKKANKLLLAINAVLWNDTEKMWYDFNLISKQHYTTFIISNLIPIWAQAFDMTYDSEKIDSVLAHLQNYSILNEFELQIPISAVKMGFIWDYPTTAPKLEAMVMEGLANLLEFNSQQYFNTTISQMLRNVINKYVAIKQMAQQENYGTALYIDRGKSPVIGSYIKLVNKYYNVIDTMSAASATFTYSFRNMFVLAMCIALILL